jgi:putative ABC transport system ATP-binding protein
MPAIIELKRITKTYRQGAVSVEALRSLDLSVQAKEFTALCGPSGSGKTTCLNLIGALDRSTSGETWVEGRRLESLDRAELSKLRRDRIGFIFQSYNLIPVLSVLENTEFILDLQGVKADLRKERCFAVLKAVGLQGLESRFPEDLSGGQQQRVAIARAIVHEPAVVLADEPTANLDSVNAAALLDLMEELNRSRGVTFVFSTHDERVMRRAHRLVTLKDGRTERDRTSVAETSATQ